LEAVRAQTDCSLRIYLELRLISFFRRHGSALSLVTGMQRLWPDGRRLSKISETSLFDDSITEQLMLLFDLFNRFSTEHNMIFVLLDHQILRYFVFG
jgi:hypothetical protein